MGSVSCPAPAARRGELWSTVKRRRREILRPSFSGLGRKRMCLIRGERRTSDLLTWSQGLTCLHKSWQFYSVEPGGLAPRPHLSSWGFTSENSFLSSLNPFPCAKRRLI